MSMFAKLSTWWSILVHHAHAGTLPDPPTGGNGIVVQPVNPHMVTPEAPAAPTVTPAFPAAPEAPAVPVGTPPHAVPSSVHVPPPPPPDPGTLPLYDESDANGFVALLHVTDPQYANVRHAIFEVAHMLQAGSFERASAELNVGQANGEWSEALHFIGVCIEIEQFKNETTGALDFRLKQPTTNIPNTRAWPNVVNDQGFNLGTVQGVTDWLNHIAKA